MKFDLGLVVLRPPIGFHKVIDVEPGGIGEVGALRKGGEIFVDQQIIVKLNVLLFGFFDVSRGGSKVKVIKLETWKSSESERKLFNETTSHSQPHRPHKKAYGVSSLSGQAFRSLQFVLLPSGEDRLENERSEP